MYIKSVTLDGFKSYGRRTEILGFDREFNAITGLNGTGKSNILDSICFVLGISNLVQVRATSLQDLVYKSGQAGITKATVTITFDNSDQNQCPIGYEKCKDISVSRQVVVGGKNKYLINGKNVLNKRVQDLFCSVQLNVNNPNFLIMQGRITKVLNMKPNEILSMIEEAAGTSMYENKRETTLKNLERKDLKLKEMRALLEEEIEPKLKKLREERAAYVKYQQLCTDIEYYTRVHISYRYLQYQESLKSCRENIEKLNENITKGKEQIETNTEQAANIDNEVKDIQKQLDIESGGTLKGLEDELKLLAKNEATAKGEKNAAKSNIDVENRKLKALEKSIKDDEIALKSKENEMSKVGGMFESLKAADKASEEELAQAQARFEAISSGLSTNEDGQASSLQEQLMTARGKVSEATTTIKQSEMEIKQLSSIVREKQNESRSNDTAYTNYTKNLDIVQNDIKQLTKNLSQITYQDGQLEELQDRKGVLTQECRRMKSNLDQLGAYRYDFQYRDPERDFDRNRVKGMVCTLFDIKDNKNALALSIAGGGTLYNVVVDSDITGKKLLQHGELQSRTTFIPLNKISGRAIEDNIVKYAQDLVGKENVASALSLISYDRELDPVMKFVFGRTLICRDMNIARQVTYNKNIHCRSVTLEGDIVDPDGSLSGGAAPTGGAMLAKVAEIKAVKNEFISKEAELKQIIMDMARVESTANAYNSAKSKLELRTVELENIKLALSKTSFQQHQTEIEEMNQKVIELKAKIVECRKIMDIENKKAKDIEMTLKDAAGHRERELKQAEQNMKLLKKNSDESRKSWKKREQEYETLKMVIEELKKSIVKANEQWESLKNAVVELEESYRKLEDTCKESIEAVDSIKIKIKEQNAKINSTSKELKQKLNLKEKLEKNNQDLLLHIKKQENEIKTITSENKDAINRLSSLERKYEWIPDEKQNFGVPNTRYDYTKQDPVEAGKNLTILLEQKEKMGRNINQKAMTLLQREEEQFSDLVQRIDRVEADRKNIIKIIKEFDEKKKLSLQKAWREVNQNFGSIFSTLLPGTNAKLQQPDGMQYYEGLEVKVSFNGLWKETLTELSGGQRSLVALSLILAMLKFKPAPLYILDEVDAALDLSHTQNIGQMLKVHFKNSQFIVVSLKEGMFNNANVLFRTKFIDGMSGIERTVNSQYKK